MWRLAISSSSVLVSQLAEQAGVDDGQRRLTGERLEQFGQIGWEGAGAPSPDHQYADHLVAAQHRNREHRPPAVAEQDVQEWIEVTLREVGNLYRPAGLRGPAHVGRFPAIVIARSCSNSAGLLPKAPRTWNDSSDSSYSRIGSAVGAQGDVAEAEVGEPHRISDDAFQNLVEIEARADRLFHLPKRLELCDFVFQLAASGLECAHQADLPQHNRALNGEFFEEFALAIVEGCDVGTPHRQHADHLVLKEHRRGQQRAEPGETLQVAPAVIRVLEHVGNLMGAPVRGCTPNRGRTVPGDRILHQVSAVVLRCVAGDARQAERVAVHDEQLGGPRSAQPGGGFDDGVQNGSGVGDVATERREYLAAGCGLLARITQLPILVGSLAIARVGHSPPFRTSCQCVPCRLLGAMAGRALSHGRS